MILELGANDALRGLDPARAKANLDKIITTLKAGGAEVLLAGMLAPRNLGRSLRARLRRHLPGPRHQARADPLSVLPRRRGHGRASSTSTTACIPTARASAEITKKILPSVEQLIERARAKQAAATKG